MAAGIAHGLRIRPERVRRHDDVFAVHVKIREDREERRAAVRDAARLHVHVLAELVFEIVQHPALGPHVRLENLFFQRIEFFPVLFFERNDHRLSLLMFK